MLNFGASKPRVGGGPGPPGPPPPGSAAGSTILYAPITWTNFTGKNTRMTVSLGVQFLYYRSQGEDNVFTSVCLFTGRGELGYPWDQVPSGG